MFEKFFTRRIDIWRHENAPYRKERERYLEYCEQQGYTRSTILLLARELFWIAKKLHICPEQGVTLKQVQAAAQGWSKRRRFCGRDINPRWARIRFIQVSRTWFSFLGIWREPERPAPFEHLVESFKKWMEIERGFSPTTICRQCGNLRQFLLWYADRDRSISDVCLRDIDDFLAHYGTRCHSRTSVKNMATILRGFFRYAGFKGWCSSLIAQGIRGPRIYAQEQLPLGPSWKDVSHLISSMETDNCTDIRDKAIVMLFAIYGFRSAEVETLRLDDIDWEQNLISVLRAKRKVRQTYPLIPIVGNAIIRYLLEVRPQSICRELFLTLIPPFQPLSRGTLYGVTSRRMTRLGIHAAHLGPHSLRHACATRLLSEGFSIKEIGDHLGHRCSSATRIYAKVDLPGLREVATFDTGGLI